MYTTLISAQNLMRQIADPDCLVFDLRHDLSDLQAGRIAHAAGHIPGAHFLHMDEDLSGTKTGQNGRHPLPERKLFAARLAALGVNQHSQIVVYDAQGGMMAARLWWMMRWLGHQAVAVLDGGLPAWLEAGGMLEETPPRSRPTGNFSASATLVECLTSQEVLHNLEVKKRLVLDARAPDRFRGENETLDPTGGHIPGARNRFFRDNLQANGQFKPAETLRQDFKEILRDFPTDRVIAQCGSGVTACHNLLAMEIAGLKGAALYAGSWSEWCSDPFRPVALGD